ncbi:MAG: four helix bundle protein [Candidatus Marinimicrobia bacterium]|nr:four helix bundle protein [Candidatus Neomarinimicrobiota bacterium]
MSDYKDLNVWKISIDFVENIYKIANNFPKEEVFGLSSQLKKAVISIPSNIAEGANRNTNKEFVQFLYIALGSASEVETQLIIAKRLNFVNVIDDELENIMKIRKMLNALIRAMKNLKK